MMKTKTDKHTIESINSLPEFEVKSIITDNSTSHIIDASDSTKICVLIYDTINGNINTIYAKRYFDGISDELKSSILTFTMDSDEHDTILASLIYTIKNTLKLEYPTAKIQYLGKIDAPSPLICDYSVYAIDLTNIKTSSSPYLFKDNISTDYLIKPIKFHNIINSSTQDALLLAAIALMMIQN